jgi:hypothetical protein
MCFAGMRRNWARKFCLWPPGARTDDPLNRNCLIIPWGTWFAKGSYSTCGPSHSIFLRYRTVVSSGTHSPRTASTTATSVSNYPDAMQARSVLLDEVYQLLLNTTIKIRTSELFFRRPKRRRCHSDFENNLSFDLFKLQIKATWSDNCRRTPTGTVTVQHKCYDT